MDEIKNKEITKESWWQRTKKNAKKKLIVLLMVGGGIGYAVVGTGSNAGKIGLPDPTNPKRTIWCDSANYKYTLDSLSKISVIDESGRGRFNFALLDSGDIVTKAIYVNGIWAGSVYCSVTKKARNGYALQGLDKTEIVERR